ncbi:YolD-like family protein [Paenibacillus sp. E222]|uniref:YolD-like family protein n=1 Tax=Paenibacillus sp. E222 TaxID=2748863 RepID=UPI0015C597FF|nr:YolD-like family protein [Paenibacillus sp. E222]QLG39414.1 YolD-like family protein [Paenibacillus sp. E222]
MGSKLSDNGIYEGSRMILPEHKEAYLAHMREQERRGKPVLDEQEVQLIEQAIFESYKEQVPVTLTVFNPFDDEDIRGVIASVDRGRRAVKIVRGEEDYSWIRLEEITRASL